MKAFIIIMVILIFATRSNGDTKVWIYNTDITDPRNWENSTAGKSCSGLVFAEKNSASLILEPMTLKGLILPTSGSFKFPSGSRITFDENSEDPLNCVKLKQLEERQWLDISGWNNTDDSDNPAIPYNERLPGRYDDVILPSRRHSNVQFGSARVKSITIGQGSDRLQLTKFDTQLTDVLGLEESSFGNYAFQITNEECKDVTGCTRGVEDYWAPDYCKYYDPIDLIQDCEDPIRPVGFCNVSKCGASIIIEYLKPGFRLKKIKMKLKEYKSYTHASKISDVTSQIQIIFTEKQFTGQSIVEAREFYDLLREDESYFCGSVKLLTSGFPLEENSAYVKNALSVTFGTLVGVFLMFGLLFFAYSPTVAGLNIRKRLLGSRPLSTYILRYGNIEDRGYIVDGESQAGSVLSLNKSFENPLYEHTSSSPSTSNETIASAKLVRDQSYQEKTIKEIDADLEEAEEMDDIAMEKCAEDVPLKEIL